MGCYPGDGIQPRPNCNQDCIDRGAKSGFNIKGPDFCNPTTDEECMCYIGIPQSVTVTVTGCRSALNNPDGTNSDCLFFEPYCSVSDNECHECTTNADLNGDGIDNDQCRSYSPAKTCDAEGWPERLKRCNTVTNTCSVCGGCDSNDDCNVGFCCEATSAGGPGGSQCRSAGTHPSFLNYLCKS